MSGRSASPPSKRTKLEPVSPSAIAVDPVNPQDQALAADEEADLEFQCSICLQDLVDRTVVPTCSHEFCFECLMVWSEQSRRCPLCSQAIGDYLIHNIRSKYDFRRHHLTPLRKSPQPARSRAPAEAVRRRRTARERERERRLREEREANDKLSLSIEKRRWIYKHDLYAKHVASNSYTRYRPYPTPAQFAATPELISRTTTFLRRELQIWDDLDVEFLTTFTISMMKSIDIRSESAVKLLAEFLDMDAPYVEGGRHVNAEHFAHEVYSYVRSPFRDLFVYDTTVQYDVIPEAPTFEQRRGRRWQTPSGSRSRSRSRSHSRPRSRSRYARSLSRDRSVSWSPSGRRYPSTRNRQSDRLLSPSHLPDRSRERRKHLELPTTESPGRQSTPSFDRHAHPQSTVGTVHGTSQRPTGSAKGKERANAVPDTMLPESILESPHLGPQTAVGVDSIAQGSSEMNQEAPPSALERKKPPRNRSLLESVQAHLTLGTKSFPAGKVIQSQKRREPLDTERHCDTPFSNHEKSSTVPSLLSRLSDSVEAAQRTEGGPELNALTSPPSTAHRHQELSDDNQPTSQSTKMSAPEIMARTRARMIKNLATSDPPSSSQLQTAGTLSARPGRHDSPILSATVAIPPDLNSAKDLPSKMLDDREDIPRPPCASTSALGCASNKNPLQIQQIPVSGELDGGDLRHHEDPCDTHMAIWGNPIDDRLPISAHINDISHPSASSDARAKLLARLEQEKTHASIADTTRGLALPEHGHDRTFPTVDTEGRSISAIQGQAIDTSAVDPQMMEAKLRTRAQLQVRLAAEKRSSGM